MKKKISRIVLIALVALALLIVVVLAVVRAFDSTAADPHAGHNHASGETHDTGATEPPIAIEDASKSFTLTEEKDGTYSYTVKNKYGKVMYSEKNLKEKPTFTVVNDAILEVSCVDKTNFTSNWAVYCNIVNMSVAGPYTQVLGTYNGHVARVEYLSEKWFVFVMESYGNSVPLNVIELTDLTIKNGNPEISCEKTKDGKLEVTYATADGYKTVTVDMNV